MLRDIVRDVLIVLYDEDLLTFGDRHRLRLLLYAELCLVFFVLLGQGDNRLLQFAGVEGGIGVRLLGVGVLGRQDDGEGATLSLVAVHRYGAVHCLYGHLDHRQARTNLCSQALALIEGVEHVAHLSLGNASARVEDLDLYFVAPLLQSDVDFAVLLSIFHRV